MKQLLIKPQVKIKLLIRCFLLGIVFLHILLWIVPRKIDITRVNQMVDIPGDVYLIITPGGRLVGWGGNDHGHIAKGNNLFVPYFARKTILKNVSSVAISGFRFAMAVDKNGILWGWGNNIAPLMIEKRPLFNLPVKVMEATSSFFTIASPTVEPGPEMIFKAPFGNPASSNNSTNA